MWTQANDSSNEPVAKIQTARQRSAGCYLFIFFCAGVKSILLLTSHREDDQNEGLKVDKQQLYLVMSSQGHRHLFNNPQTENSHSLACWTIIWWKQRSTEIKATTHSSVISPHVSQRASATATARAWMAACASSAVTSPRAPTARPACPVITETRPTEANARVSSQRAQHGSPRN